jgi:glycerol-3-phosphate acyltransferase PlsX
MPDSSVTTIAVDAMGGDQGPAAVIGGVLKACRANPDLNVLLFGREHELAPKLRRRRELAGRVSLRHVEGVVAMGDRPRDALRAADATSMGAALSAVAEGEADAALSCGNTGALMLMATMRLRKAPMVDRPAIAVFWPSRGPAGWSIVLDVGADIRAEPWNLAQYAVMGAEYARVGLEIANPRVGLLNIGSEDIKGRPETRAARDLIAEGAAPGGYDWVGFVEGGDISGGAADVIVTDGFTGNVALKTAEGTAAFIGDELKAAFRHSILSRLAALAASSSLRRMRRRIDPRRVNGGVFLGLQGAVVKAHGGSDATGVASALVLAARMGRTRFAETVAAGVARMKRATAEAAEPPREILAR